MFRFFVNGRLWAALAMMALAGASPQIILSRMNPVTTQAEIAAKSKETTGWINGSGAQWIWPAEGAKEPNQYANFIQEFSLEKMPEKISLVISVDTNYAVWVNGKFVDFGAWSNFPDDKTYDELDLKPFVKAGGNRLAIVGYWQGHSSSTYSKGNAGLLFGVKSDGKTVALSGKDTAMRRAVDYQNGPVPMVTGQLGYTFTHYGDKGDGWAADSEYDFSGWAKPAAAEMAPVTARPVRVRPVAKLRLEDRLPMRLVAQGRFVRNEPKAAPADAMQADSLKFEMNHDVVSPGRVNFTGKETTGVALLGKGDSDGIYLVFDTGSEIAGLLDLELDAPAGTMIDIGYGEHLDDMRVRTEVGRRNFAVRHVTPAGPHRFMHPFLRLAGRYIQLQVTLPKGEAAAPVILQYAGLRPTEFPVDRVGKFEVSDSLHNKIFEVSGRTLELCMHEHYEDCPWREQALYGMDARNQALAGYYCFGNYDFARESIGLLGQSMNPEDGYLELCAPAKVGITIPSFSMAWILMLDDYMMYRGDLDFIRKELPIARSLIETVSKDTSGPVVATPRGKRMWNFYEWAPGLDGGGFENVQEVRYEAPLNLFYLLALDATARMMTAVGEDGTTYSARAGEVRRAIDETFWDEKEKAYQTFVIGGNPGHFAELTQALALLAGVPDETRAADLRKRLASDDNGWVASTLSHTQYKFEALMQQKDVYGQRVFDLIERDWGYMLFKGATSFWETIEGADAFGRAGSLCHGWSGVPAYFYGAYVLGVKPTAPGFEKYERDPVKGVFPVVKGLVPTPTGEIEIKE